MLPIRFSTKSLQFVELRCRNRTWSFMLAKRFVLDEIKRGTSIEEIEALVKRSGSDIISKFRILRNVYPFPLVKGNLLQI